MEEMTLNQRIEKRRNNEDVKLIAEEAVVNGKEKNKIRELYRILNEIPEAEKRKNWESDKKLRKNGMGGIGYWVLTKWARQLGYVLNLGETKNLSRAASEQILENEMHGMGKRNP